MAFTLPAYHPPDFAAPPFTGMPAARFDACPADGIAPPGFHATSIFPEYVQMGKGRWTLCREGRMDCVIVREGELIVARECRRLRRGQLVLVGRGEDGEDGIYVHTNGFDRPGEAGDKFSFRTRITRETSFSRDYDFLYELLRHERDHGFITWVLGPAVAFDRDSREAMAALIASGYCHAVMAGNALAVHDLEASMFGTALGQDIYSKKNAPLGHYHHLDLLNEVRRCGSMIGAIEERGMEGGIIGACIKKDVPFVLAGSIRDDGPLPETEGDAYAGQDLMRGFAVKTTTAIALATQLHSIAFGNMLPSFIAGAGGIRPVYFYIVDISEFAVDKLANRGSLHATGISTNVQDFCVNLRKGLIV